MAIRASIFDASDIELKIVLERSLQSGDGILDIIDEVSIRGCSTASRRRGIGSHLSLSFFLSTCMFPRLLCLRQSVKSSPCLRDRPYLAHLFQSKQDLSRAALLSSFSHALFSPHIPFRCSFIFIRLTRLYLSTRSTHASRPGPKTELFWRHSIYFVQSDDLNCSIGIWMRVKRLFLPATRTLEAANFSSALPLYSLKIN